MVVTAGVEGFKWRENLKTRFAHFLLNLKHRKEVRCGTTLLVRGNRCDGLEQCLHVSV